MMAWMFWDEPIRWLYGNGSSELNPSRWAQSNQNQSTMGPAQHRPSNAAHLLSLFPALRFLIRKIGMNPELLEATKDFFLTL